MVADAVSRVLARMSVEHRRVVELVVSSTGWRPSEVDGRQRGERAPDHVALPARPAGGARYLMTDVHRLLEEFIAEDRAGGVADPAAFLARVDGRRARRARGADRRLSGARPAAGVRPRGVRGVAARRGSSRRSAGCAPAPGRRCCRGCATGRGCSAPSSSRGWRRLWASAAARPRSRPTTTRWSRGRCRPRASQRPCAGGVGADRRRERGGACARRARSLRRLRRRAPAAFARVASPRRPSSRPPRRRAARGRRSVPERDEVDELFTGGA